MHEFAVYSVIPPEGCAAILWRDSSRKVEAAAALKLTAPDLLTRQVIDQIVPEPVGGAHTNPSAAAAMLDGILSRALNEVRTLPGPERLERRYKKFRQMGRLNHEFRDEAAGTA
jgi:acetyl-CoA carboxylase carboxyl transferase subunit alpha